ncbi:carbamoyltransferase C-terminal domain-containing protein [Krasilnikovia sp. MM14-A1259]|uniref:carbamoyltransferase C-terminal domain-containing protein n=1 Tax=Krasilnikovia sp. MM14-A1259 TaxID=3373539 RepID=UPI00399C5786
MAIKPGHDGSIAAVEDGRLLWCLESEKDTFPRRVALTPTTVLAAAEGLGRIPDVVALGGWEKPRIGGAIGAGYEGVDTVQRSTVRFFGKDVELFSSSHERSHLMMALGMAPHNDSDLTAVLVWEGVSGVFHLVDREWRVVRTIPVLSAPGERYAFLFSLADPTFPDRGRTARQDGSGKLMALASYGNPDDADADIIAAIDRLLKIDDLNPAPKGDFADTVLYNAGVESEATKTAAALLSRRLFETFAAAALHEIPAGLPLRISGGCGLNCDWNAAWRDLDHFSDVFVPPCTNDSGSAIGTAIDALAHHGSIQPLDWDVYSGLEFVYDCVPDASRWQPVPRNDTELAAAIASGRVVSWVQGRWEIGPRALGNRSLLAEPYSTATRDRLNWIKQREDYRPIAPICREEDLADAFVESFPDPYMLYFRRVRSPRLGAVTHVDGSARAQSVTQASNPSVYSLLSAFAEETGMGVLCNTSLNLNGQGFVNRMSDLIRYSEARGIDDMVVGDVWYRRSR